MQEKIKSQILEPRSEQKEFAFTRIMTCGLCGSGITADEKFKHQQNGNVHRYVYYKCTRTRDQNCPCGFINEDVYWTPFLRHHPCIRYCIPWQEFEQIVQETS